MTTQVTGIPEMLVEASNVFNYCEPLFYAA
jgi:hypothetical protein